MAFKKKKADADDFESRNVFEDMEGNEATYYAGTTINYQWILTNQLNRATFLLTTRDANFPSAVLSFKILLDDYFDKKYNEKIEKLNKELIPAMEKALRGKYVKHPNADQQIEDELTFFIAAEELKYLMGVCSRRMFLPIKNVFE